MKGHIPSTPLVALHCPLRPTITASASIITTTTQQTRSATFIRRPRRPYTFTQLVQLSDGSTYTARSTSPQTLYRSAKDTRNALLWQPSERSLRNVELDEAGKLAAFRDRFGLGFEREGKDKDKGTAATVAGAEGKTDGQGVDVPAGDSFADLITGYASMDSGSMKDVKVDPKKKKK